MESKKRNLTTPIAIVGGALVLIILVLGTVWMGQSARHDTEQAARSVSLLYLDELAGRREQVVEDNLKNNINVINVAVTMIDENDLSDLDHLHSYQRNMKQLFNLDRFAFIDENNLMYTANEGILSDASQFAFDYQALSEPGITIRNVNDPDKKVDIAVPIRDLNLSLNGNKLIACAMEIDMDVMLQGVSMASQSTDATFCNMYTSDGIALSSTVLGGLAAEDNLLDALAHAEFDSGYSYDQLLRDFAEGNRGIATYTYDGVTETLSYTPIEGTNWFLTYLIRDDVISERIGSVSEGIIQRSLAQSILTVIVLAAMFLFIASQMRKNARLALERETAETENRIKRQEMEEKIALQDQLLAQKTEQEQQSKMITALSSDYRSVYYLELDRNRGICYQARKDLPGFEAGEEFDYLEAVTEYCNHYILEQYREEFLNFIQPESIREGLKDNDVISYRYMITVDGKESYEAVRFAGVRHPEDRDDGIVHNVGACFADVDAETRAGLEQQQALSDALTAAEQASKAKTAFLSNMSHEIRTPMNAIIGLNSIALNEPDVPDAIEEYLLKIGASAQHLLGIINDILDMSRIESGKMIIKNDEFSFANDLKQVNTIISGQCTDKGITYDCRTIGTIDDYYVGDSMKLKQVMINILGNAVKFTPEGGTVTFLIEEGRRYDRKCTLKLTIKDTGIGMSEEFLPHIFEAFSQEDASTTSRYVSTGLGLPITKSIVELMNGHIEVESTKGVGTTFYVTVTLEESDRKNSDAFEEDLNPRKLSVLAIDDDPIALEHAQIILKQVGITCEVASSGAEAVEMVKVRHARRADYNLLLVDWKMPDMDGIETTRQIRSIVGDNAPIIILTSYNWDEVADEAISAGVDTFVAKPLFAGSVLDEFKAAFKKKGEAMAPVRADLKGRRVLLAEDMPVNAEIMVMVLTMREMDVDLAENGRIAVDMFTEHPSGYYDAILMDMRMPEMDGLEATRVIRASDHKDAREIPIIALTANAFDEDVQRSLQAGLNAHLSKPVEPEALFETLESLIKP
ncbi:MAG: response regulator [Eggerthellaceae bacterium]|nr:response regulator [Eggerthellaceae bacterium]